MTDEITLREYLTHRLDTLEAKVDENRHERREEIARLFDTISHERCSFQDCQKRCDARRAEIWERLDDLKLFTVQHQQKDTTKSKIEVSQLSTAHINWLKWAAVFAACLAGVEAIHLALLIFRSF